jgi:hypothetical protein
MKLPAIPLPALPRVQTSRYAYLVPPIVVSKYLLARSGLRRIAMQLAARRSRASVNQLIGFNQVND